MYEVLAVWVLLCIGAGVLTWIAVVVGPALARFWGWAWRGYRLLWVGLLVALLAGLMSAAGRWPTGTSALYLTSALAQSTAALLALSVTVLLIVVQMTVSRYSSPMIAAPIFRNPQIASVASLLLSAFVLPVGLMFLMPPQSGSDTVMPVLFRGLIGGATALAIASTFAVVRAAWGVAESTTPEGLCAAHSDACQQELQVSQPEHRRALQLVQARLLAITEIASRAELSELVTELLWYGAEILGQAPALATSSYTTEALDWLWYCSCAAYAERGPNESFFEPRPTRCACDTFLAMARAVTSECVHHSLKEEAGWGSGTAFWVAQTCLPTVLRASLARDKSPLAVWQTFHVDADGQLWDVGRALKGPERSADEIWYAGVDLIADMGCVYTAALSVAFVSQDAEVFGRLCLEGMQLVDALGQYRRMLGGRQRDDWVLLAGAHRLSTALTFPDQRAGTTSHITSLTRDWVRTAADEAGISRYDLQLLPDMVYIAAKLWMTPSTAPVADIGEMVRGGWLRYNDAIGMIPHESWFIDEPGAHSFERWYRSREHEWWPWRLSFPSVVIQQLQALRDECRTRAVEAEMPQYWTYKPQEHLARRRPNWESSGFEL